MVCEEEKRGRKVEVLGQEKKAEGRRKTEKEWERKGGNVRDLVRKEGR